MEPSWVKLPILEASFGHQGPRVAARADSEHILLSDARQAMSSTQVCAWKAFPVLSVTSNTAKASLKRLQ